MYCQCCVLFLGNMPKFLGHTHFLEVCATSKEIMLLYDNGFVMLRYAYSFSQSSFFGGNSLVMAGWKAGYIKQMGTCFCIVRKYIHQLFSAGTFNVEFWSILGDITSYLSSDIGTVTKAKLLALLAVANIVQSILLLLTKFDILGSLIVYALSCFIIFFFPVIFTNYKLFIISRNKGKNNRTSPGIKKSFPFKKVSSCLLTLVCLVVLYVPVLVYIALRINSEEKAHIMNDVKMASLWAGTISAANGTCNCLIFYWKNTILRTEGVKMIKATKVCQRV